MKYFNGFYCRGFELKKNMPTKITKDVLKPDHPIFRFQDGVK